MTNDITQTGTYKILKALKTTKDPMGPEIAEITGLNVSTVRKLLGEMKSTGHVEMKTYYATYSLKKNIS